MGSIAATELADRYGTPLFAYDAQLIRRRIGDLLNAIPHRPLHVNYSAKAHANPTLLRLMRAEGIGVEACSPADLLLAQRAGFEPGDIVYASSAMSTDELQRVAEAGVLFSADSLSQVERYGRIAAGAAISLRINPAIRAGFHEATEAGARDSKFGIHPECLAEAIELCRRRGLSVVALHGHVGSGLLDDVPHVALLDTLLRLCTRLPDVTTVNLGGGWGAPFRPEGPEYPLERFGTSVTRRLERHRSEGGRTLALRIEPGGWVVIEAGVLLTRVCELKLGVPVKGERTPDYVLCDTSFNHLPSAVIYKTRHPVCVADRPDEPPTGRYHVAGNLMQAADVLARDQPLPNPRPGDVLVFGNAGGYASARTTTFNQRPRPAEVLIDGDEVEVIRQRETVEDLVAAMSRDLG